MKKLKNIIGCGKLPDILFVQVSGLYGIPYSSYPPKLFHANSQSIVWKRHVVAHADRYQHGGRKSVKTFGIQFCYKRQSDQSHEQVNFHINTSRKTSTVQIVKNHGVRHFFKPRILDSLLAVILMSCSV